MIRSAKKIIILTLLVLFTIYGLYTLIFSSNQKANIDDSSQGEELKIVTPYSSTDFYSVLGKEYKYVKGHVYEKADGDWIHMMDYRSGNFDGNYVFVEGSNIIGKSTDRPGEMEMVRAFADSFEGVSDWRELFDDAERWHLSGVALQSPSIPEVSDYVSHRKRLYAGSEDFVENRFDLEDKVVHSGSNALRFEAVEYPGGVSKASIGKENMYFVKGDDVWMSGWFYVEEGMPHTIIDLETRMFKESPGPRLIIRENQYLGYESKFIGKPNLRQTTQTFPKKEWVHVKAHFYLQPNQEGYVEIWQDDIKIIEGNVPTIPTSDTILNSLEVGISAAHEHTVMVVDDIKVGITEAAH